MKKGLIGFIIGTVLAGSISFASSNYKLFDTQYHFNKAYIVLGGGDYKKVDIDNWHEWDSGERQVETKDGDIYYGSLNNIILVYDK